MAFTEKTAEEVADWLQTHGFSDEVMDGFIGKLKHKVEFVIFWLLYLIRLREYDLVACIDCSLLPVMCVRSRVVAVLSKP